MTCELSSTTSPATNGGLVWINLDKVERIYRTSYGSTFEFANTVIQTNIPFEKIPDLLGGGRQ